MRWWSSIANRFARGHRRGPEAQLRCRSAYQAVFRGHPTKEDQEIVLADLASYSGFFMYHPKEASDGDLRYGEGRRSVFGRVHGQLTMTVEQQQALQEAARAEAAANNQEDAWE